MELTVATLRAYIRDTATLNKVFAGVEFEDSDFSAAILWGRERIQSLPPYIERFDAGVLPVDIQRTGALASLFEMAAMAEIRNMSNLSEAGVPVPVGENAIMYERLADKYEKNFDAKAMKFKEAYNMHAMFRDCYQRGVYANYPNSGTGNME